MSLIGSNNEQKIWNYLYAKLGNAYGVAGIMGNMQAESGLKPTNLQNSYETKLGHTDASYTAAVDNGSYTNFIYDKAGYGLVQWTYWSLKRDLYNYAKSTKKSIGDLEMQLEFLCKQLSEGYSAVWNTCKSATTVLEASNAMLLKFERPADQSVSVQNKRASYGQTYYDKYAKKATTERGDTVAVKIGHASIDERGKASGGVAGDQTGKEVCTRDWYNKPWICVIRPKDSAVAEKMAKAMEQACANNKIGYDQYQRTTLYTQAKACNWDLSKITVACETDCSALVAVCVNAAGVSVSKDIYTGNEKAALVNTGKFTALTDSKYISSSTYLKRGDVLLANGHTAIVLSNGSGVQSTQPVETPSVTETNTAFPAVPFTVKVLISDLNYRSAGSMSGKVLGQTGKGSFTITEVNSDGWGKLKSGAGWIYLKNASYCTIGKTVESSKPATFTAYKVKVTADVLNIRKGAGTNYGTNGTIKDKGIYTIVAEADGQGATKWGKLKSGAGWISLDWCKKV